jgi:hypothetical protein
LQRSSFHDSFWGRTTTDHVAFLPDIIITPSTSHAPSARFQTRVGFLGKVGLPWDSMALVINWQATE